MNFPMEKEIFQFLYWLMNTPGLGGIAVVIVVGGALAIYTRALFFIAGGAKANEVDTYVYPTPALHRHE